MGLFGDGGSQVTGTAGLPMGLVRLVGLVRQERLEPGERTGRDEGGTRGGTSGTCTTALFALLLLCFFCDRVFHPVLYFK